MKIRMASLVAVAACMAAAPVYSQTSPSKPTRATEFRKLDRNGDGKVSAEEARVNADLKASFEALDTNHDGFLSSDEYGIWNGTGKPVAAPVDRTTGPGGSSNAQHMPAP
jgi:hypothetical protein